VIEYSLRGTVLGGLGNRHPRWAPQGVYRCAVDPAARGRIDGEWIAISVRDDQEWAALVEAVGRAPWAADPALRTVAGRRAAHDAIDAYMTGWLATRTPGEAAAQLRGAGVPAATLLTAPLMYDEPHLVARSYYQPIVHPLSGTRRYPGWPMQFSFGPPTPHRCTAPTLGQHNDEVLMGILGLGADDMARLRGAAVVGEQMVG
jgi:crotonobetainyl-CoA:carnitine CoA-transferase CaiB-like acyl-CoA transferase